MYNQHYWLNQRHQASARIGRKNIFLSVEIHIKRTVKGIIQSSAHNLITRAWTHPLRKYMLCPFHLVSPTTKNWPACASFQAIPRKDKHGQNSRWKLPCVINLSATPKTATYPRRVSTRKPELRTPDASELQMRAVENWESLPSSAPRLISGNCASRLPLLSNALPTLTAKTLQSLKLALYNCFPTAASRRQRVATPPSTFSFGAYRQSHFLPSYNPPQSKSRRWTCTLLWCNNF